MFSEVSAEPRMLASVDTAPLNEVSTLERTEVSVDTEVLSELSALERTLASLEAAVLKLVSALAYGVKSTPAPSPTTDTIVPISTDSRTIEVVPFTTPLVREVGNIE